MRKALGAALAALLAGQALAQEVPPASTAPVPAGTYGIEATHSRVLVEFNHLTFSNYMFLMSRLDATLQFDPERPETMSVTATVDLTAINTMHQDPSFDFDAMIEGPDFLDAGNHPEATFTSTSVKLTGENTTDVTGDLTFRGVTKPLTLSVRYNGGYESHPFDTAGSRIGFSAEGSFLRSDWGITAGIPAPGSNIGVADEIHLRIEAEFVSKPTPLP